LILQARPLTLAQHMATRRWAELELLFDPWFAWLSWLAHSRNRLNLRRKGQLQIRGKITSWPILI
jgi:hypothetical protein